MHRTRTLTTLAVTLTLAFTASSVLAQDESMAVEDGGIHIDGWMGKIDAREAERGGPLEGARLAMDGSALHVTTGPAVVYWNASHTASGDYVVSATFTEPAYMSLNNHPHPYGLFIGGSQMGTEQQSLLYCATYGNSRFIVRGFGPEAFQVNGQRPEENAAINAAAGQGEPVTQEIAISVNGDTVSCSVNGTVVGSYPRSEIVGEGRLTSTDGIYGIRFGHNTEGTVTGLTVTGN
jgi:hypothetical protein